MLKDCENLKQQHKTVVINLEEKLRISTALCDSLNADVATCKSDVLQAEHSFTQAVRKHSEEMEESRGEVGRVRAQLDSATRQASLLVVAASASVGMDGDTDKERTALKLRWRMQHSISVNRSTQLISYMYVVGD